MNYSFIVILIISFTLVHGNKYLDEYDGNEYEFGINDEDYHPMTRTTPEYEIVFDTERYTERMETEEETAEPRPTEPRRQPSRPPVIRKYIRSLYDEYDCVSADTTTITLNRLLILIHYLLFMILYLK